MITLLSGRSGSGKSFRIEDEVVRLINAREKKVCVIVPEQETVVWEARFAEILPPSANLRLEVTNFTRLANSVFREYGGLSDVLIDDGARLLILWRAMMAVWGDMRVYNKLSSREDRNLPILMRAIDELKGSGISPAEADAALGTLLSENDDEIGENHEENTGKNKKGSLADRLNDVVLVYSAYESLLSGEYIDKADREGKLAEKLRECPFFEGKAVFIDSFLSFTSGQERIIREILRGADDVTISFVCDLVRGGDEAGEDVILRENETFSDELQFTETTQALLRIEHLCDRVGREFQRIHLWENRRHEGRDDLSMIERHLFDYGFLADEGLAKKHENSDEISEKSHKNVKLIECRGKYDEAEACSAIVAGLIREGYRFDDIAIVARDISKYDGIVDSALRRHGFACYTSVSSGIMVNPAISIVESLLLIGANGWRRSDVIRLLKTGLHGANPKFNAEIPNFGCEFFEKYTAVWNIRGRRMYAGDDWSMNPAGYKIGISEYGERVLGIVNTVRRGLILPADEFLSRFDGGAISVVEIAKGIVEYAEKIEVQSILNEICREYRRLGMVAEASKIALGWQKVCEILDRMVDFLGDTVLDCGRFLGLFRKLAAEMDVGSIPSSADEIMLGSALGIRLDGRKCIIILGSNDGEFPGSPSPDKTFFDFSDKYALEGVGLNLSGFDEDFMFAREYLMYYRAVSAASDKLFVLFDEGGVISDGASSISRISAVPATRFADYASDEAVFDEVSRSYWLNKMPYGYARNIEEINKNSGEDRRNDVDIVASKPDDSEKMNEGKEILYLSQTKIETYLSCPFNFACKYRLGISERPVGEMRLPDVGIVVHRVLEQFFCECVTNGKNFSNMSDGEISDILDKKLNLCKIDIKRSVGEIENRIEYLFKKIKSHLLVFVKKIAYELTESGFYPMSFETKIGRGGIDPVRFVVGENREVVIEGIVDRVDLNRRSDDSVYLRVIDYKTGNTVFDSKKIQIGNGLQLLIYLFSLISASRDGIAEFAGGSNVKIGGGLYFSDTLKPVRGDPGDSYDEIFEKSGESIAVSGLMNSELAIDGMNIYSCDESKLRAIFEEIRCLICEVGCEIMDMNFEKNPRDLGKGVPCEWCENSYICRNERKY